MELRSGPASLRRGDRRVEGKLVLDGRHLRFQPTEGKPEVIEVVDIKRIDRAWTKLGGVVPVLPNDMHVVMRNGQTFAFTVSGRKAWIAELSYAQADTPKG